MERWKKRYALWTAVAVLCAALFVGCTTGPAADREMRDPAAFRDDALSYPGRPGR